MSKSASAHSEESDFPETVIPECEENQDIDANATCEINTADRRHPRSLSSRPKISQLGDYVLEKEIGRGGMGIVYEATELTLQRSVAVKILLNASELDKMQSLRFANESRAAAQLSHPCIVPVYGVGQENGIHYYVMRLVRGRNLDEAIKAIRYELQMEQGEQTSVTPRPREVTTAGDHGSARVGNSSKRRSESHHSNPVEFSAMDFARTRTAPRYSSTRRVAENVARIGVKVADALQHAHDAGVIHRDIKPCNLMLDESGEVWVTDFGLAQIRDAPSITRTGVLMGTLRYMSPEQAAGKRAMVDHRTDIYSLGITLCELLTLKHVIEGKSTQEIIYEVTYGAPVSIRRRDSRVPVDLATIVEKAMSRDPLDRYATAGELSRDLTRFLNNEPIHASRPPVWKRCRQWMARHRAIAATLVVAFLATFVVTAVAGAVVLDALIGKRLQLKKTEAALTESEGLRLLSNAALELPKNPGLSLVLAAKGAAAAPGLEANTTIQVAMEHSHEYATVMTGEASRGRVAISPDGKTAISCADESHFGKGAFPAILHRMSDGSTVKELSTGDCITSAAFSPSGQYIVTTSADRDYAPVREDGMLSGVPVLWDAQSGEKLKEITGTMLHQAGRGVFSPLDASIVLCRDNVAVVYNYSTNKNKLVLRGHSDRVTYCEFSPDGKKIATLADDDTVRIWDSSTGMQSQAAIPCRTRKGHRVTLAFTAESNAIIVCDLNGISLIDIGERQDDQPPRSLTARHFQFATSREQPVIALIDNVNFRVAIVNSQTLSPICEFQLPKRISDVAFPYRSKQAAVACGNQLFLFDTESGQGHGNLFGHTAPVRNVVYSPTDNKLASVAADHTLRLWHSRSGAERSAFARNSSDRVDTFHPPMSILSNDDERIAITFGADYSTVLRGFDGKLLPAEYPGRVATEFSCNTRKLITKIDNSVIVTEVATSRELYRCKFPTRVLEGRIVSVDQSRMLIRTEADGFLVNLADRSRVRLGDVGESIKCLSVSKDLRTIVVGTSNGLCISIDAETGEPLKTRKMEFSVQSVHVSSDGTRYVATDSQGNVQTGKCSSDLPNSTFQVAPNDRSRFIGDSSRVVNWSFVKPTKVECRHAVTGELLGSVVQDERIRVCCHPDLPVVAIASDKGTQLWYVDTMKAKFITNAPCQSIAFSDRHLALLVAGDEPSEGKPEAANPERLLIYSFDEQKILHDHGLEFNPVSLRVDHVNQRFAITRKSFAADVYNFATGEFLHRTTPHAGEIGFTTFLNENWLLTLSENGQVNICNNAGEAVNEFLLTGSELTAVGVSPDGRLLVTADGSGDIFVWDTQKGTEVHHLSAHNNPVEAFSFDRSGHRFCSLSADEAVYLWDLRLPEPEKFEVNNPRIAQLSPDGNRLLIVSGTDSPDTLVISNLTENSTRSVSVRDGILHASFLDDGGRIGLLSAAGRIEIIDALTGGKDDAAYFVGKSARRFHLAGNQLMAVRHINKLAVWNMDTGNKFLEFGVLRSSVTSRNFNSWRPSTADGRYFTINKGTVRRVPSNPLEEYGSSLNRSFTDEERQRFRLDLADRLDVGQQ